MEVVVRPAISTLLASAFVLLPVQSQSQPAVTRPAPPLRPIEKHPAQEVTIYRDRNFQGPAVSIPQNEPNLRLAWTVSSARVNSGQWQLCERPNYQGSCLTLSASNSNLGLRRVQSARVAGMGWRMLGDTEVNRVGWDKRVIDLRGNPVLSDLRFCAERTGIRFHDGRVRSSNNRFQVLRLPSQVGDGACTNPIALTAGRVGVSSVDVTAATTGMVTANRGRLRLEGR